MTHLQITVHSYCNQEHPLLPALSRPRPLERAPGAKQPPPRGLRGCWGLRALVLQEVLWAQSFQTLNVGHEVPTTAPLGQDAGAELASWRGRCRTTHSRPARCPESTARMLLHPVTVSQETLPRGGCLTGRALSATGGTCVRAERLRGTPALASREASLVCATPAPLPGKAGRRCRRAQTRSADSTSFLSASAWALAWAAAASR